jgi:hypothetical protein
MDKLPIDYHPEARLEAEAALTGIESEAQALRSGSTWSSNGRIQPFRIRQNHGQRTCTALAAICSNGIPTSLYTVWQYTALK